MNILIQKKTISEKLGISLATLNNWIKTKVIPSPDVNSCYSQITFENIVNMVKSNQNRLNSRANRTLQEKKSLCYLGIVNKDRKNLLSNLVNDFENSNLSIDDGVLSLVFSILHTNGLIDIDWHSNTNSRLDTLLSEWVIKISNLDIIKHFFIQYKIENTNDDILGAFYQSVQSISRKSSLGSYYTPSKLLTEIKIPSNKTILDPCCGSGSILFNIITKKHDTAKIFAKDIDETALKICFINLVLFFNNKNILSNISKQDLTLNNNGDFKENIKKFDYIVTNPPWGSKYNIKQKEYFYKLYPELVTSETFSICLYNATKMLNENGELYFFLPHSFLNVATHRNIRCYMFNEKNKISIRLLGNAFKGVLSESILLHLKNNSTEKDIFIQNRNNNIYQIPLQNITAPNYIVSATSKTKDSLLIEKIYKAEHIILNDETIFALGIVTGNNKNYLTEEKTIKSEAIFRGKDIDKYVFLAPRYYIEFQSSLYQQVARVEYYRQPKIVYRFISNRLVCVLDMENNLILNSANLFIAKKYPMETIVTLFNSDIYTFLFQKLYHSRKVLKSHLQHLPLPILSNETHKYICNLYYETFSQRDTEISLFQGKIEKIICDVFSIDKRQFDYIKGEI